MINLVELIRDTFLEPRLAGQKIVALNLPLPIAVSILAFSLLMGAVLGGGLDLFFQNKPVDPPSGEMVMDFADVGPIVGLMIAALISAFLILAFLFVGYAFGGKGHLHHAVALIAWTDLFSTGLSLIIIALAAVFPAVSTILLLVMLVMMLRISVAFMAALHGFEGTGRPLISFFLAMFLTAFVLSNAALMTGFVTVGVAP